MARLPAAKASAIVPEPGSLRRNDAAVPLALTTAADRYLVRGRGAKRSETDVTRVWFSLVAASLSLLAGSASAETITIASGSAGHELAVLRQELDQFTAQTGINVTVVPTATGPLTEFSLIQRRLSEHSADIDVYDVNITWAPQLARNFIDLSSAAADIAGAELPALVKTVTVGNSLVALPYFADVPALYYRKDLLAKYHLPVPTTWADMQTTANAVMTAEREAGDAKMWGYTFPGGVSEDLTANALEWMAGNGGGSIVESDGTISVDNVKAILAVEVAEKWVGTISPPEVVNYNQADARGLWLSGEAVFTRDWHDALGAAASPQSKITGKVGVAELPIGEHGDKPASTLDGWSLAVSRYSTHEDDATALVRFLASAQAQKTYEVGALGRLPAIAALYDDPDVAKAEPDIATFKHILADIVVRPAAQTGVAYGRVSYDFALAMNRSLKREAFAEDFIQSYRHDLEFMKAAGWSPTTPRGAVGDSVP